MNRVHGGGVLAWHFFKHQSSVPKGLALDHQLVAGGAVPRGAQQLHVQVCLLTTMLIGEVVVMEEVLGAVHGGIQRVRAARGTSATAELSEERRGGDTRTRSGGAHHHGGSR